MPSPRGLMLKCKFRETYMPSDTGDVGKGGTRLKENLLIGEISACISTS